MITEHGYSLETGNLWPHVREKLLFTYSTIFFHIDMRPSSNGVSNGNDFWTASI